jgi:hypothetical protein
MGRVVRGLLFAVAMGSTGCAFMFKGSKQEVNFVAVPEGSDVRANNRYLGATPTKAELDRDRTHNIKVSKEGFVEQQVQVRQRRDTPWFFWDIATCVIPVTLCIPVLADALSGAWYSLDDDVHVKLDVAPLPPAPVPAAPAPAPAAPAPVSGL